MAEIEGSSSLTPPKRGRGRPKGSIKKPANNGVDLSGIQESTGNFLESPLELPPESPIELPHGVSFIEQLEKGKRKEEEQKFQRAQRSESGLDTEVSLAMDRLRYVTQNFGPSSAEILKIAALQVVQTKLDEIAGLLRAIFPNASAPANQILSQTVTPGNRKPMTLENIDQHVRQIDTGAAQAQSQAVTDPCELCGLQVAYVTKKGARLCAGHKPRGIVDDQEEKLAAMMKRGFGNSEEVIRIDESVIQNALAAGNNKGE